MAIAAAPSMAGALALGDIEVRSTLGQPLEARVPIVAQPGERFEAACFYISNVAALPAGVKLAMTLERSARGAALRIRSDAPVDVPAAALQLTVACPGREAEAGREYAVLLDPPGRVRAPSVPVTVAATLAARADDSLAGIARKVFPRDANARALYLHALEDANPALAAAGDAQPIAAGSAVALPDLRDFAAGRKPRLAQKPALAAATPPAAPAAPKIASAAREPEPAAARPSQRRAAEPPMRPQAPPSAARAPRPEAPAVAAPAQAAPAPSAAAAARSAPKVPVARATEGPFVLRLSGAEMDLSRSRGIDEPKRSRLRERMLILDADDQVAALLSMRNNLRQLESRVTELQLKLAQMPTAFPDGRAAPAKPTPPGATAASPAPALPSATLPPKAAPAPPSPAPTTTAPPVAAPVAVATPAPIAAKPPTPVPAPQPAPAPPDAAAPSPAPSASSAATPATAGKPEPKASPPAAPSKPAPAVATPKPAERATGRAASSDDNDKLMTWGAIALGVLLLLVLAAWWWRRRQAEPAEDEAEDVAAGPEPRLGEIGEIAAPVAPPAVVDDGRRTMSSDADLPTRLRDTESGDLRQRYIDERFPEVASGAIRIDDPDSLVKGARLFYEDGALPRAVELLQFAVERRAQEPRAWLALFEIFRLERLTGEFAELARRFREHHGETDDWRKVQFFGREIDPANPLYRHEPVNTLETIGPREAHKVALSAATFDPIAENWLNAPMDFENEVLANELRKALMTQAGLTEQDLAPNPMPALRNVEMFTVA